MDLQNNESRLQRNYKDGILSCRKPSMGNFLWGRYLNMGIFTVKASVDGRNAEVRNLVVGEFLGNVGKLISHKEAGMVVNDVYRDICTPSQKLEVLQELYGPEFRLFKVVPSLC